MALMQWTICSSFSRPCDPKACDSILEAFCAVLWSCDISTTHSVAHKWSLLKPWQTADCQLGLTVREAGIEIVAVPQQRLPNAGLQVHIAPG